MNLKPIARAGVAALLSSAVLGPAVMAQQPPLVGAVGAVNPRTTGQPPMLNQPRQLVIADDIVLNERIIAGPDGAAQVMFIDQTTLTVGPNSDVIIDSYLYNPEQGGGEMALSLARGAMRFIGGRITKSEPATVDLAGAVVAVRGGIADMRVVDGGAEATFLGGEFMTVTRDGETVRVSRPGGRVVIGLGGGGLAPGLTYAGVVDAAATATLYQTTRTPGTGGARQVAASGQGAGSIGAASRTGAPSAPAISTSGELAASDIVAASVQFIQSNPSLGNEIASVVISELPVQPPVSFGQVRVRPVFALRIVDGSVLDGDIVAIRAQDAAGNLLRVDTLELLSEEATPFETLEAEPGLGFIEVTAVSGGAPGDTASPELQFGAGLLSEIDSFFQSLEVGQTGRLDVLVENAPLSEVVIGSAVVEPDFNYFLGVIVGESGPIPVQVTVTDVTGEVSVELVDLTAFPALSAALTEGPASIRLAPQTTVPGARGTLDLSAGFLDGNTSVTFAIDQDEISEFSLFVEEPFIPPTLVNIGTASVEQTFTFTIAPLNSILTSAPAVLQLRDSSGGSSQNIDLSQVNTFTETLALGSAQIQIEPQTTVVGEQGQITIDSGILTGDSSGVFDITENTLSQFFLAVETLVPTDLGTATVENDFAFSIEALSPGSGFATASVTTTDAEGSINTQIVSLAQQNFFTQSVANGAGTIEIAPNQTNSGDQGQLLIVGGLLTGDNSGVFNVESGRSSILNFDAQPQGTAIADPRIAATADVATVIDFSAGVITGVNTRVFGSVPATLQVADSVGARPAELIDLNPGVSRNATLAFGAATISVTPEITVDGLQGDLTLDSGVINGASQVTYPIARGREAAFDLFVPTPQ
jgi:hypothetical protein